MAKKQSPIFFENRIFNEDIIFTDANTPLPIGIGVHQVTIDRPVTFRNCTFKGRVMAYQDSTQQVEMVFNANLSFLSCQFEKDVSFRNATVNGRLDFSKSIFRGVANFEGITAQHRAFFNNSYFSKEARFQNAAFQRSANFMDTKFMQQCSFQQAIFKEEAQFSVCQFGEYADFSLVDARGKMIFNYSEFFARAVFEDARFMQGFDFLNVKMQETFFTKTTFMGRTRLDGSTVGKKLRFGKCFFLNEKPDLSSFPKDKVEM